MTIVELYGGLPPERHGEVLVQGDRLFFAGEEYLVLPDGELRLVRSLRSVEERLARIETSLGIGGG